MGSALCDPGANPWIAKHLYDCVYTTRDAIGFSFGIASIAFWVVAQIPQFVLNIKRQSVEALSSWFLAQWLLGDTCNLVGCILTGSQLPTQTWTAVYFISADMVMLLQYIFYMALQRRRQRTQAARILRQRRHLHYAGVSLGVDAEYAGRPSGSSSISAPAFHRPHSEELVHGSSSPRGMLCASSLSRSAGESGRRAASSAPHARVTLSTALAGAAVVAVGLCCALTAAESSLLSHASSSTAPLSRQLYSQHTPEWAREAGVWLGWMSGAFYLSSRTSQLYKNWSRSCCEGLSLSMFLCAISANISYGAGILIRSYGLADLQASAPWIVGSLGVVVLDVLISLQGCLYPSHIEGKDYSRILEPLLVTGPAHAQASSLLEDCRRS